MSFAHRPMGFASADPDNTPADWLLTFRGPSHATKAFNNLRVHGVDVSVVNRLTLRVHNQSNRQINEFWRQGIWNAGEGPAMPKPAGPPTQSGHLPGQDPTYQHREAKRKSPYARLPGTAGQVFLKYAIHFASVSAAALAAQEMRKRGIDSAQLDPDGTLVVGLRDVLQRVLTAIAQKFGGQVQSATQTTTPPPKTPPIPVPKKQTQGAPFTPPKPPPLPSHLRTRNRKGGYQIAPGQTFAFGLGGAVVRAVIRVAKPLVADAMREIRSAGARVLKTKVEMSPGGVAKAVLAVEGTRQVVKDLRKAFADDEPSRGAGLAVDAPAVAYAVMDALSDEASRAIIDYLVAKSIQYSRRGAHALIARVRDTDLSALAQRVKALGGRFSVKRKRNVGMAGNEALPSIIAAGALIVIGLGIGKALKALDRRAMKRQLERVGFRVRSDSGGMLVLETEADLSKQEIKDEISQLIGWLKAQGINAQVEQVKTHPKAASMALPALLVGAGAMAVYKFIGLRVAEAAAFYLASKGIEAVAHGAEVIVKPKDAQQANVAEQVARAKGGRRKAKTSQAASMGMFDSNNKRAYEHYLRQAAHHDESGRNAYRMQDSTTGQWHQAQAQEARSQAMKFKPGPLIGKGTLVTIGIVAAGTAAFAAAQWLVTKGIDAAINKARQLVVPRAQAQDTVAMLKGAKKGMGFTYDYDYGMSHQQRYARMSAARMFERALPSAGVDVI